MLTTPKPKRAAGATDVIASKIATAATIGITRLKLISLFSD